MNALRAFTCKAAGLSCLSFCIGIIAGIILPICAVAVIEAAMILFIGFLCLFKW